MQTQDRRACASCGAANTLDAPNCWQCFARFDAAMPEPPAAGTPRFRPGFPPPTPTPAPVAAATSAGPSRLVAVLVAAVAAVGGFLLVGRLMGGGEAELPDTLGGFERRHDQLATQAEEQMATSLAGFDVSYDTGLYGEGPVPEFAVVLVEGRLEGETADMFEGSVTGFSQAGAEVVSEGAEATLDGATHRCVGLRAQGAELGACMWRGDDGAGVLVTFTGDHRDAEVLLATIWPDLQAA
jgi:hypothetical protein